MTPCDHLTSGSWPFTIDLVLDAELSFTDAFAHCSTCAEPYLLELLDERAGLSLFRVSMPGRSAGERLLHNLSRGSCDLNRASAEVQSVRSLKPYLRTVLLIDPRQPAILDLIDAGDTRLPGTAPRELPRDGSWFERLRVPAPQRRV